MTHIMFTSILIFVLSVIDSLSQSFLINSVSAWSREGWIFWRWARRVRIRTRIGGLIEVKSIIFNLWETQLGRSIMCMESCDIRSVVRWRRWRMGISKNDAKVLAGISLVRLKARKWPKRSVPRTVNSRTQTTTSSPFRPPHLAEQLKQLFIDSIPQALSLVDNLSPKGTRTRHKDGHSLAQTVLAELQCRSHCLMFKSQTLTA